jgi:hypothetical protein
MKGKGGKMMKATKIMKVFLWHCWAFLPCVSGLWLMSSICAEPVTYYSGGEVRTSGSIDKVKRLSYSTGSLDIFVS